MGWLLRLIFRRFMLLFSLSLAGAVVVVCGGPVSPPTESGAAACSDPSWTAAEGSDPTPGDEVRGQSDPPWLAKGADGSGSSEPEPAGPARGEVIEDATGHSLDAFYEALAAVDHAGEPGLLARISCFGDSHTAADFMTGQLRRRMQKRFGDGGHGFIAAGKPWRSYRHRDIRNGAKGAWDALRVRHASKADDEDRRFGLAGVSVETDRAKAKVWASTRDDGPVGQRAGLFEVYYLSHPRGGRFGVHLDDELVARLSSRGPEPVPSYFLFEADEGPHVLQVETLGRGTVRLFGFVFEREGPGVTVDSLGINGARVTAMLAWDEPVFTHNLARRSPDLVVLWYGANSVADDWYTMDQYEQWIIDAVTRIRDAVPDASCLLLGPPDMARPNLVFEGPPGTPPALGEIITAQRDAATLAGCGFFDTFEAMGGTDSNLRWSEEDPSLVAPDGIHFTIPGYEALADLIYDAIVDGYEHYLEENPPEATEPEEPPEPGE